MKDIVFYNDKLLITVPDNLEYTLNSYESLTLYMPNSKAFTIKVIVVDSNDDIEKKAFYDEKCAIEYANKVSEDKKYNVLDHEFNIDDKTLLVTSFEIIYKSYYINIRVNTLEKLDDENKAGLTAYIRELILSIKSPSKIAL